MRVCSGLRGLVSVSSMAKAEPTSEVDGASVKTFQKGKKMPGGKRRKEQREK